MDIQQRIHLLVRLGAYLEQDSEEWRTAQQRAALANPWFTPEFIRLAVQQIQKHFLQPSLLLQWAAANGIPAQQPAPKTVGIVMAGNLPLVGFHDLLCVFLSGHMAVVKTSSKDEVLIHHLVEKLCQWEADVCQQIRFAALLKGCDAYIATGSNNSGRYFDYYFGQYPHIIRRNRTSIALLDGQETAEELSLLADDIQLYFGLGCRNVTQLYVPQAYDFLPLLQALKKYEYLADNHKYKHNYDYYLALLIMNGKFYMNSGNLVLVENPAPFSPVSQVHYQYYTDKATTITSLQNNTDVQCIVAHGALPFGQAQSPGLEDYADGVNTLRFLLDL